MELTENGQTEQQNVENQWGWLYCGYRERTKNGLAQNNESPSDRTPTIDAGLRRLPWGRILLIEIKVREGRAIMWADRRLQVLTAPIRTGSLRHHGCASCSKVQPMSFWEVLRPVMRVSDLQHLECRCHAAQAEVGVRLLKPVYHCLQRLQHSLPHCSANTLETQIIRRRNEPLIPSIPNSDFR